MWYACICQVCVLYISRLWGNRIYDMLFSYGQDINLTRAWVVYEVLCMSDKQEHIFENDTYVYDMWVGVSGMRIRCKWEPKFDVCDIGTGPAWQEILYEPIW